MEGEKKERRGGKRMSSSLRERKGGRAFYASFGDRLFEHLGKEGKGAVPISFLWRRKGGMRCIL